MYKTDKICPDCNKTLYKTRLGNYWCVGVKCGERKEISNIDLIERAYI